MTRPREVEGPPGSQGGREDKASRAPGTGAVGREEEGGEAATLECRLGVRAPSVCEWGFPFPLWSARVGDKDLPQVRKEVGDQQAADCPVPPPQPRPGPEGRPWKWGTRQVQSVGGVQGNERAAGGRRKKDQPPASHSGTWATGEEPGHPLGFILQHIIANRADS